MQNPDISLFLSQEGEKKEQRNDFSYKFGDFFFLICNTPSSNSCGFLFYFTQNGFFGFGVLLEMVNQPPDCRS